MKKILALMGALTLGATTVSTVVACGDKVPAKISINGLNLEFNIDNNDTSKETIEKIINKKINEKIHENYSDEQKAELGIDYIIGEIKYDDTNSKVIQVGQLKVEALKNSKLLEGNCAISFTKELENKFQNFGSKEYGQSLRKDIILEMKKWMGKEPKENIDYNVKQEDNQGSYKIQALSTSNLIFEFSFDSIGEVIDLSDKASWGPIKPGENDLEFIKSMTTKTKIEGRILQIIQKIKTGGPYYQKHLSEIKQGVFYDIDEIEYDADGRPISEDGQYFVYAIDEAGVFKGKFPFWLS